MPCSHNSAKSVSCSRQLHWQNGRKFIRRFKTAKEEDSWGKERCGRHLIVDFQLILHSLGFTLFQTFHNCICCAFLSGGESNVGPNPNKKRKVAVVSNALPLQIVNGNPARGSPRMVVPVSSVPARAPILRISSSAVAALNRYFKFPTENVTSMDPRCSSSERTACSTNFSSTIDLTDSSATAATTSRPYLTAAQAAAIAATAPIVGPTIVISSESDNESDSASDSHQRRGRP